MAQQQEMFHTPFQGENDQPGTLVKTYQTQVTRAGMWFFAGSLLVLVAVVVAVVSMIIFLDIPMFRDPFYRPSTIDIVMNIVMPPLVLLLIYFFFYAALSENGRFVTPLSRKMAVSLYTNGLIFWQGRKRQIVPWEQVHNIERRTIRPWLTPLRQYRLQLEDNSDIPLPRAIAEVDELGQAIERAMIDRLLPQTQADYAANKTVVFTGLCLTQKTIGKSDESLPWSEVECIRFDTETLSIKEKGRKKNWLTAPIVQFRNVCVLEALLAQIREECGLAPRW